SRLRTRICRNRRPLRCFRGKKHTGSRISWGFPWFERVKRGRPYRTSKNSLFRVRVPALSASMEMDGSVRSLGVHLHESLLLGAPSGEHAAVNATRVQALALGQIRHPSLGPMAENHQAIDFRDVEPGRVSGPV